MKKVLYPLLLCFITLNVFGQSWSNTGNALQRQVGSSYTNYRFNLGTPGFWYLYGKTQVDSLLGGFAGPYLKLSGGQNGMKQSIIFNTNSPTPIDSVHNGFYFTNNTNYVNIWFRSTGTYLSNTSNLLFDFGDDPASNNKNGILQRFNSGGLGPRIDTVWEDIFRSNRERFRYKNSDIITARQVSDGLKYTVSADSTNGGRLKVDTNYVQTKNSAAYDLNYRVPIDTTQTLETFGDSYTAGSLATAASKRYVNIVFNTIGSPTLVNQGAGGSGIISAQNRNYSVSPATNNLRTTTIMSGLTDIGHIAPDQRLFSMLYNGYTAFLANKFLKTAIPASDASITYSGSWTSFASDSAGGKATYISGSGRQTLTTGATATFTVTGNNVFIGTFASDSTKVKMDNFTVTVDGNLAWAGSFDNQLKYFQPLSGGVPVFGLLNWYTQSSGVFLNNLGPGSHTIVVTKGSNTSRKLILDYVGTLNNPKNTGSLVVGEIAYLTDSARLAYHIEYGSSFTNASIDSANYYVKQSLKAFQGWPVTIARTNHYFDYRTEVSSVDSLHPNDLGHLHIAQAFLGAMALPNYRSGYTFGDGLVTTGSTITNAITQAGGYTKAFSTTQGTPPGIAITQSGTTAIAGPIFSTINTSVTTGGGVTGPSIIASRSGTSVAGMTALPITVNTGARAAGGTGTDLRGISLIFTGSTATSSTASNVRNNPFKVDLYNTTAAGESGTDIAGLFRVNGLSSKTATALRLVSRGSTTNDALNIDSGSVVMRELTALKPIFTDATKRFTSTGPGTSSQIFFGDGSFVTSSGDVTNSAGAFTIGANKVTYAKIQAAGAASRLVGSPSSGTTLQDITLGSNLNITSGTLNATSDTATLVTKGTDQNVSGKKYYTNGITVSRNVNDANPSLIVNKQQGTGSIQTWLFANSSVATIDKFGSFYSPKFESGNSKLESGILTVSDPGSGGFNVNNTGTSVLDIGTYNSAGTQFGIRWNKTPSSESYSFGAFSSSFNWATINSNGIAAKNVYSTSSAPTITVGANAGTGATVSIVGTNQDGVITVNTGTGASNGPICTVTMSGSFSYPTSCVPVLTQRSGLSPVPNAYISSQNGNSFTISINGGSVSSTTIEWNYHNGGY